MHPKQFSFPSAVFLFLQKASFNVFLLFIKTGLNQRYFSTARLFLISESFLLNFCLSLFASVCIKSNPLMKRKIICNTPAGKWFLLRLAVITQNACLWFAVTNEQLKHTYAVWQKNRPNKAIMTKNITLVFQILISGIKDCKFRIEIFFSPYKRVVVSSHGFQVWKCYHLQIT